MNKNIFFLVVVMAFPFFGCTNRTDYLRRYGDFLNYSLGDFTVLEKRTRNAGVLYRSWVWDLQFTRQNGEERIFRIDNNQPLHSSIIWGGALGIMRDSLQSIASNYFTLEELQRESSSDTRVFLWSGPRERIPSTLVLDPQNGLQLYSVTSQELVANWGFALEVECRTCDWENYTNLIKRLKTMTRTLSAYLEQDEILLRFILSDSQGFTLEDISFGGIYNRQTDTFKTLAFKNIEEKTGINFNRVPIRAIENHLDIFR